MLKSQICNSRVYTFLDIAYLGLRDPAIVARQLIAGGADIIQLRAKNLLPSAIAAIARRILPITRAAHIPLIINDHVEIARAVDADGVHLGQEDATRLSIAAARDILGRGRIIGLSTHSVAQARGAQFAQPDYIGFGPIFPTGTKPGRPAIGLAPIHLIADLPIPFFCIGGINETNLSDILDAGARRIAVVAAILRAPDIAAAARSFKQKLQSRV